MRLKYFTTIKKKPTQVGKLVFPTHVYKCTQWVPTTFVTSQRADLQNTLEKVDFCYF